VNKVAAIASLMLFGQVVIAAPDMTAFGLTIGEPARLPECLPFVAIKTPGMYLQVQPVTCKKSINLLKEMKFHEVVFGYSLAPTWVSGALQIYESVACCRLCHLRYQRLSVAQQQMQHRTLWSDVTRQPVRPLRSQQ
jgi:hypothetical protein